MFRALALLATALFFANSAESIAADLAAQVAADLRPATGVIVMPVEGEFLVDLDATKGGIRDGDLLTVVRPGGKIIHPVSKEVLGTLDEVKAILQVTRVKSGYSYARPVGAATGIGRGDTVLRFEKVPAAFRDAEGNSRGIYDQLNAALPHLDWQGYSRVGQDNSGPEAPLVFFARGGNLEVLGPQSQVLRTYRLPQAEPSASVIAPAVPAVTSAPAIVTGAATPLPADTAPIVRRQDNSAQGIWFSGDFAGEITGLAVGDFDGDGRQEIVTAFAHRLEIGRLLGGKYERVTQLDLGLGQKVLRADSADLDADGRPELYLTAADEGQLRSLGIVFSGTTPRIRWRDMPWYFRAVQLPGEGEVLLGQRMGGLESDFGAGPFRVKFSGGELKEGATLVVPRGVDLYGMAVFKDPAGQELFADFNIFDHLQVIRPEGERIWESNEPLGGSEAFIERQDPTKNPAVQPATRYAFMQPRIEVGPNGEILVPANEGIRNVARFREFKKSRLLAMTWNGYALEEKWHSRSQDAYLADFRLADADNDGTAELVQALVFSRPGLMGKGRSAVAIFELQ